MENKEDSIQKYVTILVDNFITDKDKKNFVIYKGQKLETVVTLLILKYEPALKRKWILHDYKK